MTWFIVAEDRAWREETEEQAAQVEVWTLSRDPNVCGWNTDGGYDGYGLTKSDAQFLCDAANEKEAREAAE